ncbi:MAG: hypothetical protein APF80_14025 [Alphaproteobacteria bacterium BRH_c36]|nr:MAG: hypothetical protein APF80_14025 [Alphaproteobacteria bacterium BRH_c36]
MLQFLFGFRANVFIAFAGAFTILVLIKLTSLLPGKYYFSFSKLYAGASEPFIVDPPSVTASRLCELMSKHNLSPEDIGRSVNCAAKLADGTTLYPHGAAIFKKEEVDRIYSIALALDSQVRSALVASGNRTVLVPLSDAEFERILSTAKSVSGIYRQLLQAYESQIGDHFETAISNSVESAFANVEAIEDTTAPTDFNAAAPVLKGLTPEEVAAARQAHAAFIAKVGSENLGSLAEPLTKSTIDRIIDEAYVTADISHGVTSHYTSSIKTSTGELLRDHFEQAGVKPVKEQEAKQLIFSELVQDGLANYIVATLLRLLPVLVFGIALGFVFGRQELFSTSFAGALAAFLLTWPIMLMWDRVVQSSWHEQKETFLLFYAVYIVSFFLTARLGALIGIRMSEGAPERVRGIAEGGDKIAALKGTSWAELIGNIVITIAANGVVAAWNVIIPVNAG